MTQTPIVPRNAVDPAFTWNAPKVFATIADWELAFEQTVQLLPTLQQFAGHLADNADTLVTALEQIDTVSLRVARLTMYANFAVAVDTTDQQATALADRAGGLQGQLAAATAFRRPEIIAIGTDTIHQWCQQEPRLAVYTHYFDSIFRLIDHIRTTAVEEILGLVREPFASVAQTATKLINAEMPFPLATDSTDATHAVNQASISTLLADTDRELRRTAYESYADGHLVFKNTLASNLATAIKQDVFYARVRRFSSSLESALFTNAIPVEVFHNTLAVYKEHLPTWHRYWAARRRMLNYATLHPYDIFNSLSENPPTITYPQAVDFISAGMQPLGDEYVQALRKGCLEDRWVDVYPNLGKRSGAFSYGTPDTFPFIMMSYTDNIASMSTLAHELGHSLHSYHTWQSQPLPYANYSLFVAEVASNFNQAMVRAHLLRTQTDRDFQLAIIDEAMRNFHRYFFIMPTLARFELAMHERSEQGKSLTADYMNATLADLFSEGYGDEVTIDRDREGITWAQFNHMYANFYVFQYATGIAGAHALSEQVLTGDPQAAERYRSFLRAGGSLYPLDALKLAGVDMTTPEPVERTFGVLSGLVDRLEQLASQ